MDFFFIQCTYIDMFPVREDELRLCAARWNDFGGGYMLDNILLASLKERITDNEEQRRNSTCRTYPTIDWLKGTNWLFRSDILAFNMPKNLFSFMSNRRFSHFM